jgi:hypothetical protein
LPESLYYSLDVGVALRQPSPGSNGPERGVVQAPTGPAIDYDLLTAKLTDALTATALALLAQNLNLTNWWTASVPVSKPNGRPTSSMQLIDLLK